ncbi:MAG TPA: SDR family NAD(P)-dependent oxidoreductase, partial [Candidatus Kapabacteria bacterium]|nr:SDR family NAD(P)-dependent oxidoreductase [Candidatus Kapabacteria bacterium]
MNVVILSATQGMGLAVARRMAERGDTLYLLGRNEKELELVSKDIAARSGKPIIGYGLCDMENPAGFSEALNGAQATLGTIDTVVVTAAVFGTQEQFEQDLAFTAKLFTVNLTNTILFCEHARKVMLASGGGTLCVFSSVAGERGRKPVLFYGSAK